jgi:tagaturonate reductase
MQPGSLEAGGTRCQIKKMNLSKTSLASIPRSAGLVVPDQRVFELPEKVLQFGTGVLLRGLPDFIINSANNKGNFNGRIVLIKSTEQGGTNEFDQQDGLYTVCVRGVDNGKEIQEDHIVAAVSRVLSAASAWDSVLECAANPDMEVIISNTTEVGIALIKDNVHASPPVSFPGKLLSFLYQRFKIFNGDETKGMVIIPTELIPDNGDKLLAIVLELAHQNGLEIAFLEWLENANYFCNSLVDRIVPGKLNAAEYEKTTNRLGYKDELMIMTEVYMLWAIQSVSKRVQDTLSFAAGAAGVVIADDINKFRELKLRLLNGTHSFCCGLAFLAGFDDVKQAMKDQYFLAYIRQLLYDELIPSITDRQLSAQEAADFAARVLDRFRNDSIGHKWLSIAVQYSAKMNMRNTLLINRYLERFSKAGSCMALGMAGHILFMKPGRTADGREYTINDDNAAVYAEHWRSGDAAQVVKALLSDGRLWDVGLSANSAFLQEVTGWLTILVDKGALYALQQASSHKKELVNEK